MRFKLPKLKTNRDVQYWHKWYAWHPVKINDHWFWLESVDRKCEMFSYSLGGMIEHIEKWEYKKPTPQPPVKEGK